MFNLISILFQKLTFECNVLRLEIDCTKSGSYVEIDAIKIIGTTFLSDSHQQGVLKHTPVTNSSNLEGVLNNTSVTNSYNVEQWVSKVRNYSSEYDTQRYVILFISNNLFCSSNSITLYILDKICYSCICKINSTV